MSFPISVGKRVFVTDSESNTVSVIDLGTREVVKTIATGRYPHGLRLSPDGRELFVANVEDGSVSVIDVAGLAETAAAAAPPITSPSTGTRRIVAEARASRSRPRIATAFR